MARAEPASPRDRAHRAVRAAPHHASIPLADQVGQLKLLQDESKVGHIGLSEVTVDQIRQAQTTATIASVQNPYNLANRQAESLLDHAEAVGIALIPWFALATGELAREGGPLQRLAQELDATPVAARVSLAAPALASDAAEPGHGVGRAPGGELRRGGHRVDRPPVEALGVAAPAGSAR